MLSYFKKLPGPWRRLITFGLKGAFTFGAFYLLLTHEIKGDDGAPVAIWRTLRDHLAHLEMGLFLPWLGVAIGVKCVGILSSMTRWHLLLLGQGIRFNFSHIVGSFLIGRFLGTFLPSTVGLDGYKLYDAARFSERGVETAAATVVEKVMGLSGIFLSFLVALPMGIHILGESGALVAMVTVPLALLVIGGLFLALFKPQLVRWFTARIPGLGRLKKIESFVVRASEAATALED